MLENCLAECQELIEGRVDFQNELLKMETWSGFLLFYFYRFDGPPLVRFFRLQVWISRLLRTWMHFLNVHQILGCLLTFLLWRQLPD